MGDEEKIGDNRVGGERRERGRKGAQRWEGAAHSWCSPPLARRLSLSFPFSVFFSFPPPPLFLLFLLSSSSARRAVISMRRSASLCSAVWVCLNARFLAHCCMSDGKGIALQCWLHTLLHARVYIHTQTYTHTQTLAYQRKKFSFAAPGKKTLWSHYLSLCRPHVFEHITTPHYPPPTPPVFTATLKFALSFSRLLQHAKETVAISSRFSFSIPNMQTEMCTPASLLHP